MLIQNYTSFEPFLGHINHQQLNIKFTVESNVDNVLPFLNTRIEIIGDNFESCIYRKDTNTNVLLNFCAVCPYTWKKGILFGALHRAKLICSSRVLFLQEVSKLRTIFFRNGYSYAFFNKVYQSFEHRKPKVTEVDGIKDEVDRKYIFKIPYVGSLSHEFSNKIMKLFYNDLRINITPVFTTFKVSNYFSLKSQTPKLLHQMSFTNSSVCVIQTLPI